MKARCLKLSGGLKMAVKVQYIGLYDRFRADMAGFIAEPPASLYNTYLSGVGHYGQELESNDIQVMLVKSGIMN